MILRSPVLASIDNILKNNPDPILDWAYPDGLGNRLGARYSAVSAPDGLLAMRAISHPAASAHSALCHSANKKAARVIRAARVKLSVCAQLEVDVNDATTLADDAVVVIAAVPLTVAVVPDAVADPLKVADPTPPETASSSSSVSSIKTSMVFLLVNWS